MEVAKDTVIENKNYFVVENDVHFICSISTKDVIYVWILRLDLFTILGGIKWRIYLS